MCGIIACRTDTGAVDYLLAGLRRLEYRGYDSAGVAVRTTGGAVARIRTAGRVATLDQLVTTWTGADLDGAGIGHTRWATHGAATVENAHPHTDCSGRINLVHNGIIENSEKLRHALSISGHRFSSSVDSEVLCHLIEDQLKVSGDLLDAVQAALVPVEGSWALAVLEEGTGRIVVAANRSPLLVANTSVGAFATSDISAVVDWVDDFYVLGDGDVVELVTQGGRPGTGVHTRIPMTVRDQWSSMGSDRSGYADYMAKEIDEQPVAAARVLDELGGGIANGALWCDLGLPPFERLQMLGCGTSLNAGHVIGNLVRKISGVPVSFTIASEAAEEILEPGTLRLAISQSGETADVLQALTFGSTDSPILALTNCSHSTLTRRADAFVNCAAGPEIGVAATKTFVCQVIAGVAVMLSALVATDRLSAADSAKLADALRRLPERLAEATTVAKCLVPPIAEQHSETEGFIFISKGVGLPYAAEGALKLKELTYRWAEHYPAGELKHGPLALVSTGTPVLVIDNGDPKLAANIAEIAARGGKVISIGSGNSTIPVLRDDPAPWGPLESVVPVQILARTLALALGRDVDKPRNLAKSVTVE